MNSEDDTIRFKPVLTDLLNQGNERICGICHKQFATYTCPRCNLKYCSLACYKSENHAVCTEAFYKDSLVAELQGQKVPEEDRNKMLQMLKRFEKESEELEEQADEIPDLMDRLAGIDLEQSTPDQILSVLTPAEREQFKASLREGSAAIRGYIEIWRPWWITSEAARQFLIREIEPPDEVGTERDTSVPEILSNIKTIDKVSSANPQEGLIFNLVDMLAAYAFMCRFLNGEITEDPIESAQIMWNVSRILSSNQQFAFGSVSEALTSCKMRLLQSKTYDSTLDTAILAFKDVSLILASHHYVLAALSDMHKIFSSACTGGRGDGASPLIPRATRQRAFTSEKKVYYYLCLVGNMDEMRAALPVLKAAVDMEVKRAENDMEEMLRITAVVEKDRSRRPQGPLVEEL
ncbi:hypothetical protein SpCBS45565_g07887 [Spizellomyces sp. 'palustris']|nr:hypothetical protein SpCBS45565_g07887 [Spizellomyces sp. 'palustris']